MARPQQEGSYSIVLFLIPVLIAFWVWLSPLAFVPVPWPDDSAFYFVAKEFFKWPPRWVMLSQAPFEPTYGIFNFNTMPLYPILIGLGRWIGIDGSFLLKLWPLGAWALSGSLLAVVLFRKGLPFFASAMVALVFALDPDLRWASVVVRPESLIGLFGMALVLGLTFGFPKRLEPKSLWDPVAALLALSAYCHFNAIHLLPAVLLAFATNPRRIVQVGLKTCFYLSPWILTVLFHWGLFFKQMRTQWERLAAPNDWLTSPTKAVTQLFQSMGSPEPWDPILNYVSLGMWLILFLIIGYECAQRAKKSAQETQNKISLIPALGWVAGATWLFQSKPEVWFVYYFHISIWCLAGLALLRLWASRELLRKPILVTLSATISLIIGVFTYFDVGQAIRLGSQESWHWDTYHDFVSCVDKRLTELEANLNSKKPFQVWCPTFPDITIELSRKHPNWQLTRTNDFWSRNNLAIQHGWDAQAVVVTEMLNYQERTVSEKAERVPEIQSIWMLWKDYYLNRLWTAPFWKPNRYICQRGRWQAFLFMADETTKTAKN